MNDLLATLQSLEAELHHPGVRCSRERLEELLHPEFREVGRSGAPYTRETVIRFLASRAAPPRVVASAYVAEEIAEGVALLTYRSALQANDGAPVLPALRSSVWKKTQAGWQLLYHQGTPEGEPAPLRSESFSGGAVVFAKNIGRLADFYSRVAALVVAENEQDHVVLQGEAFQLVVVAIPAHIAARIEIASPPARREDTAVKLAFRVASLAEARTSAAKLGGELNGPESEWLFQGWRVCDGHDPEGNVFQLREPAR